MKYRYFQILILVFLLPIITLAQTNDSSKTTSVEKKWYESISLKGYVQTRYNRLFETNSKLKCEQCDKSWGENGGIFLRRVRIAFYGQVYKNIYFYIQPEFAGSVSS